MPTYAFLYEEEEVLAESIATKELNGILKILQEHKAKILDVKLSTVDKVSGLLRTFLILYEAESPVKW